jgi:hypothetical protein
MIGKLRMKINAKLPIINGESFNNTSIRNPSNFAYLGPTHKDFSVIYFKLTKKRLK